MSDLKEIAASGQSAAAGGLSRRPETTPSAHPALSAAPNQGGGYLSKLFGFGSGTGPSAADRPTGAMDEAHEYHPDQRKPHHPSPAPPATTQHGWKE
ncbi:MAG: hypothetical protein FRX49_13286 [Trebouxia sp. A1-2]|nr:MAG: hypothetical protein FRX49_13286 [Trebouxia sp. A1-2]